MNGLDQQVPDFSRHKVAAEMALFDAGRPIDQFTPGYL
jgi:hypothetical protein